MSPVRIHAGRFELNQFATDAELARFVALEWLKEIEAANQSGRPHCVALSGGRIAQKLFNSVVEQGGRTGFGLFDNVHFFWADERCLPPTDPESNFRIAQELLFTPLKISEEQIHRVRGEDSPDLAAESAEADARRVISESNAEQPVFDLILLGMGEDGHVASLFPGAAAAEGELRKVYRAVFDSPKPPLERVSLTYSALAAAGQVWVLASGSGKESALRQSLDARASTPLGRVLGLRSRTKVFTDIGL